MYISTRQYFSQSHDPNKHQIPPAIEEVSKPADKPLIFWDDDAPIERDPEEVKREADEALRRWQSSYESIADLITPEKQ